MKINFQIKDPVEEDARLFGLRREYGSYSVDEADVIAAIGGDGFLLHTLHQYPNKPVFGMNTGTIGFLMNEYNDRNLIERIETADNIKLKPLNMVCTNVSGEKVEALAFNDVYLSRQHGQSAKIKVEVDDRVRIDELIADGIIVSTSVGSTAYNLSASGPILPITSKMLALTPICAFRPRRWRGAILPEHSRIRLTVMEHDKRPVRASADNFDVEEAAMVEISVKNRYSTILFDKGRANERFLAEMFQY